MRAFSETLSYHGAYTKIDIIPQTQSKLELWQVRPYVSALRGISPTGQQVIISSPYKHLLGLPVLEEGEESKEPLFFQLKSHGLGEVCSYNSYLSVEVSLTLFQENNKTYIHLKKNKLLLLWHHLESHLGCLDQDTEILLTISSLFLQWQSDSQCYRLRFLGGCDSFIIEEFGERASLALREGLREICTKLRCLLKEGKGK